jgi:hypothetical protein
MVADSCCCLLFLHNCDCTGAVDVNVAGKHLLYGYRYDYVDLIRPPVIKSVVPLTGPVAGGTNVTITGLQFGFNATVLFIARGGVSSAVAAGECLWRNVPGMSCDDSTIR